MNIIKALFLAVLVAAMPTNSVASGPAFPCPATAGDVPGLLALTAYVRGLDEAKLVALVPTQSGLHFVGCPNCVEERLEGQLDWTPERPAEVECRHCKQRYPSEKYPMDRTLTVRNPRGEVQRYPYWQNAKGYRYFFSARRDDQIREYLAEKTQQLAMLYAATGDRAHGRRAALLLDRFAQVFPGWCYHYDYPFQQKEIYEGIVAPAKLRPGFRTARWTWWAYKDIPIPLVQAYDWLRAGAVFATLSRENGTDVPSRIERDLFRNAAEQVLANPENYHNMSPAAWRGLVIVGRVIGEPRYIHDVVRRIRKFVATRFFYDGSWCEGSPDYARQAVSWLDNVLDVLKGYSDPPGTGEGGERFDNLDLASSLPGLDLARAAHARLKLPDGRPVPVHDAWHDRAYRASRSTVPFLLPALGHAMLGGGTDKQQVQFHLTWSGGYGHEHADNLSLLVFGHGAELLSDLGYTHAKYRGWTLATVAHNTVVIDGRNQHSDGRSGMSADGGLRIFDIGDRRVQVVSADGERGYPGLAKVYRRTLIVVDAGQGRRYAVDAFEVRGGEVHDYFLHGDADKAGNASVPQPCQPLATLLPAGMRWEPLRNEGDRNRVREPHYAYGMLRNLKEAAAPPGVAIPITFRGTDHSSPALRITAFPEPDSRLILGENPSVRGANEDDARMDRFTRPFAMVRHRAKDGRSLFASVIEPYSDAPFVTSAERIIRADGSLAIKIQIGDRTDLVVYKADQPVAAELGGNSASFTGDVGVLSVRGQAVEHAYALGAGGWSWGSFSLRSNGRVESELSVVEGDAFILDRAGDALPPAGDVIRLVTADGWVYPYTVVDSVRRDRSVRVRVAEGPGLTFDGSEHKLRLTAFPQREHSGDVRVDWLVRSSRTP